MINVPESTNLKLDIGSGKRKREGFIGIDISPRAVADIRADLEKALPFRDNTFSEVWMNHVFEHLNNPVGVMEEIWRICRNGALVEIRGPHFSKPHLVWGDPTHKRPLSLGTFRYFDGTWHGSLAEYDVVSCTLRKGNSTFSETGWKPWYWPFVVSNFIIEKLVNMSPSWIARYERLASRFIGFEEIQIVLSVRKRNNEG
jgi:SAM-dependent methyltransferase